MNRFSRQRAWYRRMYGFNYENRRRWVAYRASLLPAGSRVLDIGAGNGQYRPLFSHCDYRTQDFGQVPGTKDKYTKLDYECDLTAIPVTDSSFDAILCAEVLEHVPDPVAALREMGRIVRPFGQLFVTAPLGSLLHQEPYHFYGGYTPHWYRKLLPECGFEVESIEANQGFFSFFGQEAQRFCFYLHPRSTGHLGASRCLLLTALWLLALPMRWVLPLLGHWLDRMALEATATVGYHVVAVKKGPIPAAEVRESD